MRRYLIPVLALGTLGTLLLGCSSSSESSTASSSTTTSSVVISAANKQVCADLTAFGENVKSRGIDMGTSQEQGATNIQKWFTDALPPLQAVKVSAPADLSPTIDAYIVTITEVGTMDPTNSTDQQKLSAMLLTPSPELKDIDSKLRTWASTNCGLTLPGSAGA